MEFFERKKGRWLLPAETSSWETWQLILHVVEIKTDSGTVFVGGVTIYIVTPLLDWMQHQKKLSEGLSETVC